MADCPLMAFLFLAGSAVMGQVATLSGPWPQFHGPMRNAISPDTGLLTQWPEDGPPLVWETSGAGRGYASLSIAGGRIHTLGDGISTAEDKDDKDEYVSCFDETDGKRVWQTKLGPAWNSGNPDWQSSRSTPTVDGERAVRRHAPRQAGLSGQRRPARNSGRSTWSTTWAARKATAGATASRC